MSLDDGGYDCGTCGRVYDEPGAAVDCYMHHITGEKPLPEEVPRPAPSIPVGPAYWDPVWDGTDRLGGYYLANGRRCSMREWVYAYSVENQPNRRKAWRKKKQVAESFVGPYRISTVFLGLDHNFGFGGRPLIFETMVFERNRSWLRGLDLDDLDVPGGGVFPGRWYHKPIDEICERYSSRDEARRGHWAIRKQVRRHVQLAHGPEGGWRGRK